jgi:hypothetical protein
MAKREDYDHILESNVHSCIREPQNEFCTLHIFFEFFRIESNLIESNRPLIRFDSKNLKSNRIISNRIYGLFDSIRIRKFRIKTSSKRFEICSRRNRQRKAAYFQRDLGWYSAVA